MLQGVQTSPQCESNEIGPHLPIDVSCRNIFTLPIILECNLFVAFIVLLKNYCNNRNKNKLPNYK